MRGVLLVAVLLAGCVATPRAEPTPIGTAEPTSSSSTSTAALTASPTPTGTRYGVAGLIPAHFPNPSLSDLESMYRSFAATGGAVGIFTNWADPGKEGAVPQIIRATLPAASQYSFGPILIALGVARDAAAGSQGGVAAVTSTVDWASPQRSSFLTAVTAVAREHKPEYLALGVETNRLWMSDPRAFDAFVVAYREAYAAIKQVSPSTKVFTIFQLELMRGTAYLTTGQQSSASQWQLLSAFAGVLDLVGFTSYPFLQYKTPSEIPDDYYSAAARQAPVPMALTEIGWPSADLPGAGAGSGYGGTPEEQAEFVKRFFTLTTTVKPQLALWAFPNDVGAAGGPTFASVALRTSDGAPKPALAAWQMGVGTK